MESFRNDANELEKQIAQKWIKIIKNALIAKRLKHDSSISLSESLISTESGKSQDHQEDENAAAQTISTFITTTAKDGQESEIEEFDAI